MSRTRFALPTKLSLSRPTVSRWNHPLRPRRQRQWRSMFQLTKLVPLSLLPSLRSLPLLTRLAAWNSRLSGSRAFQGASRVQEDRLQSAGSSSYASKLLGTRSLSGLRREECYSVVKSRSRLRKVPATLVQVARPPATTTEISEPLQAEGVLSRSWASQLPQLGW